MASNNATRFVNRSPRYTLNAEDRKLIRYTRGPRKQKNIATEIINVSETGLAFIVDASMSPKRGEKIAVEFEVPGAQKMACYGHVIRVEEIKKQGVTVLHPKVMVAVNFVHLFESHEDNLAEGLKKRFGKIDDENNQASKSAQRKWLWEHRKDLATLFCSHLILSFASFLLFHPMGLKAIF